MRGENKQRVLVVDDERVNRTVLSAVLKDENQVILAKNGEQALERLAIDAEIDLILLDVLMPDMDGYEVLRRIKANDATKDIPVIFITALNTMGDEEHGLNLGACDYIGKPFSPAIVKARVSNLLRFVRQRKLLETLAGRDGLTEIPNRRAFDTALEQEIGRSQRSGQPVSLAMLDIDYFKQFNDHYGHAQGDEVLKAVARVLTGALRRPADMVARYGGEEFVFILPDTDVRGGLEVAEAARQVIESMAIPHAASAIGPHVSVSIGGVTAIGDVSHAPGLLRRADEQLYKAKQKGRNRVHWDGVIAAE
ncbi:response regulator receiver modulated diguanylate cyclase [Formivibrio citricus]|uniref:diguanylate cyclase n=1 Tax=Formivibrio citricus TaxID=83765 RepID=A0A1I4YRG5_9NEIS|nr:diguanylate cyclase [Formivibrio citricus]SFN40353.1 response regulator receiver modulated diguanylate cyclase [Formivibrio citricus]